MLEGDFPIRSLSKGGVEMIIGRNCRIAEDFTCGKNFKCGDFVIIEKNVTVGDNVSLGNFVILEEGTRIGDNVTIEHFVLLKTETKVGNNVFIDSYVKTSGHNKIGNHVVLRFNATIAKEVIIEDWCYISPNVMTIYLTHTRRGKGGTVIGANTFVGANAVIGPGVRIVPNCIIGAMAYVNTHCKEPGTYIGIPARKKNVSNYTSRQNSVTSLTVIPSFIIR